MNTIKVKYRVIYNRRKQLDRNGKANVLIEAYQSGNRKYLETGIRLAPSEWDDTKSEVKKNPGLNRLIRERISELETFELTFSAQYKRSFTLRDFDLIVSRENVPVETFTSFALTHIERDKAEKSINVITYGRYKRVIGLLAAFAGKQSVHFEDLTYHFIDKFNYYLLTSEKICLNTAYKHHQVIQKYLDIAIKKGLFESKNNPYNDFKPKKANVDSAILSIGDIKKIENLSFAENKQFLTIYRDAFLLSFYTLLRIGDVTRIRAENIVRADEGLILEQKAQKTGKLNRLPLYSLFKNEGKDSKPECLIKKYVRSDSKPFFARSHPKLNEHVKEIMMMAGIKKDRKITFHTARHSGITYLSTILPTPIVQQLAQHSSIATTMGYIHISGKHILESLDQVNWK